MSKLDLKTMEERDRTPLLPPADAPKRKKKRALVGRDGDGEE
jgi:hypothetical protein